MDAVRLINTNMADQLTMSLTRSCFSPLEIISSPPLRYAQPRGLSTLDARLGETGRLALKTLSHRLPLSCRRQPCRAAAAALQ